MTTKRIAPTYSDKASSTCAECMRRVIQAIRDVLLGRTT